MECQCERGVNGRTDVEVGGWRGGRGGREGGREGVVATKGMAVAVGVDAVAFRKGGAVWVEGGGKGGIYRIKLIDAFGRPQKVWYISRVKGVLSLGYPRRGEKKRRRGLRRKKRRRRKIDYGGWRRGGERRIRGSRSGRRKGSRRR